MATLKPIEAKKAAFYEYVSKHQNNLNQSELQKRFGSSCTTVYYMSALRNIRG